MKALFVGDPHVRSEDLIDCENLLRGVEARAHASAVDVVVFLGDLFHAFGVINVEVLAFWDRWFRRLGQQYLVYVLVGNHDRSNDRASANHALVPFIQFTNVKIIDRPSHNDGVLWMPYYFEPLDFLKQTHPVDTIVCHQAFIGAREGGFTFFKDAVDPDIVPAATIISGHIHTRQNFGKVIYPGSPRWISVHDANVDKHIRVVEFHKGVVSNQEAFPTDEFCSRLTHLVDSPEAPLEFSPVLNHRYVVDIRGPQSWIDDRRSEYLGRARIRTFRTDVAVAKVKESDGIGVALKKYLSAFQAPNGTPPELLSRLINERISA